MRIIVAVTAAIVLGVVVMLLPIVAYTQISVTTKAVPQSTITGEENNTRQASKENEPTFAVTSPETIDKAAKTYGTTDTGPSPFPSSLFPVLLLVVTSLVAAIGASMYFKRKVKLV
jgi:ABC-type glycerol-3-phosphate transport system permease component